MRFAPAAVPAVAAALLAAGCGEPPRGAEDAAEGAEGGPSLTTTVDTVGGIVRVRNSGAAPRRTAELRVELGAVGGGGGSPDPEEFASVNGVSLAPDGRILVAESQAREVRVFSAEGEFLGTWGREGEGPGEFGALYAMAWLGDTLAVLDPGVGRIGLLGPDGAWRGQFPYPGGVSGPATLFRFRSMGPHAAYVFDLQAGPDGVERRYRRLTAAGYGRALPWLEPGRGGEGVLECPRPDGAISFFGVPFSPGLVHTPVAGRRVAAAWTADYRIAFVAPDGDTLRTVERAVEAVPVTAAEWDSALAEYRSFREEWPGVECSRSMPEKLAEKPAIEALWTDRQGRLWVEASSAGGTRYDVYDRDGRLLFEVPAPARSDRVPPYLSGDAIAVVAEGEMGVDRVRVYDLSDASPSLRR